LTPGRILIEEKALVFRFLKKRKLDSRGRVKQPQYRTVPVPEMLIENLDLVYGIRALQKKGKGLDIPLWTMSRPTAYRLVKRAMDRAGSVGTASKPPAKESGVASRNRRNFHLSHAF
jgi:integrase